MGEGWGGDCGKALSPFNETRYRELLEGLEITIFNYKEIFIDNSEFRIDSEYYRKEFLQLYKYIKGSPILDKLVYMSDLSTNGAFADVASIKHDDNPKIIPFIRSGNVGNTFINENDLEFISKEAHLNLPKSTTKLYDIMMARKGKIGGASIIMDSEVDFNCNENVIKLDILDKKKLNPFYFTAYFNSKYGIKQIERLSTGNVQPWVSIFQIRKLMIPILNNDFQLLIEKTIKEAHKKIDLSKLAYTDAEGLLMWELGLAVKNNETISWVQEMVTDYMSPATADKLLDGTKDLRPDAFDKTRFLLDEIKRLQLPQNYSPNNLLLIENMFQELEGLEKERDQSLKFSQDLLRIMQEHNENAKTLRQFQEAYKQNINIKSFKDSFGTTGRLDAEYYQKKYEVVVEKIKSQKYDTLQNIVSITKSLEPGSNYYSDDETGLPFMRVADYTKFGLSEPNKKLTFDFIKDNQDKIEELKPKKGSILFSKDGSVGTAYHLREDFEGVTSSAILNLKVKNDKEVIPEYLTLALNSELVQMQAERDAGGSIILHWRIGEIQNVVVPIIDYKKQQEIALLIEDSFSLKKQSEHLLEVAKRAVEIAIEENETVAMGYIQKNKL